MVPLNHVTTTIGGNLARRAVSTKIAYTIVLPVILGTLFIALVCYLFFYFKRRKVQRLKAKKQARERAKRAWGRDMGDPDAGMGRKKGDPKILEAAQGIGMGLAVGGT